MTVKANKKENIGLAIMTLVVGLMLLFVAAMALSSAFDPAEEAPIAAAIASAVCALCAVFFLWGTAYFLREAKENKPLIEITDTYFCDHSSAVAFGQIAWSDMERVYLKGLYLNVKLRDPDVYLSRKSALARLLIKLNRALGYGDVCINPHQRFPKEADAFFEAFFKHRLPDEK